MAKYRKTVAVDVDGVIHSYTSKWSGPENLPDPPVPGVIEWLREMSKHFNLAIYSTRAQTKEGRWAIGDYLAEHGLENSIIVKIDISAGKPPAVIYVDDRGFHFTGNNFPTKEEIDAFKPWNK